MKTRKHFCRSLRALPNAQVDTTDASEHAANGNWLQTSIFLYATP